MINCRIICNNIYTDSHGLKELINADIRVYPFSLSVYIREII